jgi:predicted metalloendopeptidase
MKSKNDLATTLAYAQPRDIGIYFGQSALVRFGSEQDAKDSSEVIAVVDQGGLGCPTATIT